MSTKRVPVSSIWLAAALLIAALAGPAAADEDGSYGYIRALDGSATLMQTGSGTRSDAEINQPLLAGDRLWVPARSRVEVVLADRNLVRIDGNSELLLERLAASPDANDRATVLRLLEGNIQLIVTTDSLGDELPRVETANSTIYIQNFGTYRITAEREDWSEVVVRKGSAEVVTDRGSLVVRADERALIEGVEGEDSGIRAADAFDPLERWGRQLNDEYASADLRHIEDDNLRYQAAPLARHGSWVYVDSRPYWRPRVAVGWTPYSLGRWSWTPSGITWISYEPWGWVPYHYGTWDYFPAYGWVWAPGYRFAPAWVYWYWGPSYAGWCPVGYYTRYWGHHGYRHGVYGWAGGHWDDWNRWNFVPYDHFGRRDQRRYAVPVDRSNQGRMELPRGIITTDTKGIGPDKWKNPEAVMRTLRTQAEKGGKLVTAKGDLPDVTPFITRAPKLPEDVRRTVMATDTEKPGLQGTPLAPGTMRRPTRTADAGPKVMPQTRVDQGDRPLPGGRSRISLGEKPGKAAEVEGGGTGIRPGVTTSRPSVTRPSSGDDHGRAVGVRPTTRPTTRIPSGSEGVPRPKVTEIPSPRTGDAAERKPIARPSVPGSGKITTATPRPSDGGGYSRPESERESPREERKIEVRERPSSSSSGSGSRSESIRSRPEPERERPPVYERPSSSDNQRRSTGTISRPSYESPRATTPSRTEPRVSTPPSRPSSPSSPRSSYEPPSRTAPERSSPSVRPSSPPSSRSSEAPRHIEVRGKSGKGGKN